MMAYQPGLRADTAARERAIDVLKAGLAEGRITRAEHDERAARVRAARTYGDLARLVADLPSGVPGAVASYLVPAPQAPAPAFNSLAVASLICGLVEIPTLGMTALPAIILADRARQQIRETGERGDALAVAGRTLGWAAAAVFFFGILVLMIWLAMPPAPGTSGPVGGG
jgi:hypothetical protein